LHARDAVDDCVRREPTGFQLAIGIKRGRVVRTYATADITIKIRVPGKEYEPGLAVMTDGDDGSLGDRDLAEFGFANSSGIMAKCYPRMRAKERGRQITAEQAETRVSNGAEYQCGKDPLE
jgi:hypothetical protein